MRKNITMPICLFLMVVSAAAQKARPLAIGERLPVSLLSLPMLAANHPQDSLKLGQFKEKLLIIDFWATWCSPCVKSLDKLNRLQQEFGDNLAVIPVTYEPLDKVSGFMENKGWDLPSIVADTLLKTYFPHRTIPHQVWIKDGEVTAETNALYASQDNIAKVIANQPVKMEMKYEDMEFDTDELVRPLKQGYVESRISERIKTGGAGISVSPYGVIAYNRSPVQLLQEAFLQERPFVKALNRLVFEMTDSLLNLVVSKDVLQRNIGEKTALEEKRAVQGIQFTYNNRSAEPRSRKQIFRKMQNDILSFFEDRYSLDVSFETRNTACWVLRRVEIGAVRDFHDLDSSRYVYVHKDKPFRSFVSNLNWVNTLYKDSPIVLDETGYDGNISFGLTCSLDDVEGLKRELPAFGFELVEAEREIEMLVIKEVGRN